MEILDDVLVEHQLSNAEIRKWWEQRRGRYNLIVGACGLLPLIIGNSFFIDNSSFAGLAIVVCLLWAIMANICYTFGWIVQIFSRNIFKNSFGFLQNNVLLYRLGLTLSILVTLVASSFCAWIGYVNLTQNDLMF